MIDVFSIVLYYFSCYSISLIITQSNLFAPIRLYFKNTFFGKIISCIMCLPFWVSILLTLLLGYSPIEMVMYSYKFIIDTDITLFSSIIYRFLDSVVASGFSWFINSIIEKNLKNTDV